ncbi:MAG: adenosylcobinamide-phosphate synthase CbiB [Thermodesulfovibrionales bacterium]|nr:adenosylcobinamide-phosphate synthase CbiB [Thermodesulfovibrionales bacterium]
MKELIPVSAFSIAPAVLILAFIVDLAIGDPRWLPHPVRLMGGAITQVEAFLRKIFKTPKEEKVAGVFLVMIIVGLAFSSILFLIQVIQTFVSGIIIFLSSALIVLLTSSTIAIRELINSGRQVIDAIEMGNLEMARAKLSMIVGRDTHHLSENEIFKATIETLSENLSDGIVAPLFYLVIGGLPFAIAYKAINTLDSMVGYKNERYLYFGWASARLDDFVNYIPARITGLLIIISFLVVFRSFHIAQQSFRIMLRDGGNHPSPNSGIPEAAMAGGLGVRLGGPATYGGILFKKPYIGEARHQNYCAASKVAISIVWHSSVFAVIISSIALYIFYY